MAQSVSPLLTVCELGLAPCAGRATGTVSASREARLEREIVILGIECLREIFEGLILSRGLGDRPRGRFGRGESLATFSSAGQENQLAGDALRPRGGRG